MLASRPAVRYARGLPLDDTVSHHERPRSGMQPYLQAEERQIFFGGKDRWQKTITPDLPFEGWRVKMSAGLDTWHVQNQKATYMKSDHVYLDHNATTPPDPEVLAAMADCMAGDWANPSSVHGPGRRARALIEAARRQVAEAIGEPRADAVVFTASGSEANNLAIQGVLNAQSGPLEVIASAIEHDCVRATLEWLAAHRPECRVHWVRPGEDGRVDPADFSRLLTPRTRLVCLMAANHETGAIQPVREVAALAREAGAVTLVDAVQCLGRMELNAHELGADFVSLSAHKFNGPKGVGALWMGPQAGSIERLIHGGGQERGLRAGTENTPGIVGMGLAAQLAAQRRERAQQDLARLEAFFLETLHDHHLEFQLNGTANDKIAGVLSLSIPGVAQEDLVAGMDLAGFAISAGAACSSGVVEPSPVLVAMGLDPERVRGAVRVSFGRENTLDEARLAAQALAMLARRIVGAAG